MLHSASSFRGITPAFVRREPYTSHHKRCMDYPLVRNKQLHPKTSLFPSKAVQPFAELAFAGGWGLWAVLAASASAAQVVQSRTRLGSFLSAPLSAIILGLLLSAAGLIPLTSETYDQVSSYILPLAAALYLLESDVAELVTTARETVVAFSLASLGTVLGTLIAWAILGRLLGPDGWKVAAALAASYVGGSVNFAATASALKASSPSMLAAAMSADMVAMAGYLAIISWWPVDGTLEMETTAGQKYAEKGVSADSLGLSLAAAATACAIGSAVANTCGVPGFGLGLIAITASILASAGLRAGPTTFAGAEALGSALMALFFVTIGAAAGSVQAVLSTGWLLAFIAVQLGVHMVVTMGLGSLLRLSPAALLTASNAAIGGPGTAAAMATSRGWSSLVRPALIVGAFGYAVGTVIGVSLGHYMSPT